jgi:N-acetyl-anhydromuramoyl-L-alanine amidase
MGARRSADNDYEQTETSGLVRRGAAVVPRRRRIIAMVITLEDNLDWLAGVRRAPSPNCDARPPGAVIDLLVVHGISLPQGQYGTPFVEDLFCNRLDARAHPSFAAIAGLRVSAHVLIRRDGEPIQFVPFGKRAWHAGESCFRDRRACNDFSIGVELEGCDEAPYEAVQYRRLAALTRTLMGAWPAITREHIVAHSDIAPGRKTDPGPHFDWRRVREGLEPCTS